MNKKALSTITVTAILCFAATALSAEATVGGVRAGELEEQSLANERWAHLAPLDRSEIPNASPVSLAEVPHHDGSSASATPSHSVSCGGEVETHNRSQRSGGMFAVLRVTCVGPENSPSVVYVHTIGHLSFAAGTSPTDTAGNLRSVNSFDATRAVPVNRTSGESMSKFFPLNSFTRGLSKGIGHWRATATWQIVSPIAGTVGSATRTSWANIP